MLYLQTGLFPFRVFPSHSLKATELIGNCDCCVNNSIVTAYYAVSFEAMKTLTALVLLVGWLVINDWLFTTFTTNVRPVLSNVKPN